MAASRMPVSADQSQVIHGDDLPAQTSQFGYKL
jgi:hypothetical protein